MLMHQHVLRLQSIGLELQYELCRNNKKHSRAVSETGFKPAILQHHNPSPKNLSSSASLQVPYKVHRQTRFGISRSYATSRAVGRRCGAVLTYWLFGKIHPERKRLSNSLKFESAVELCVMHGKKSCQYSKNQLYVRFDLYFSMLCWSWQDDSSFVFRHNILFIYYFVTLSGWGRHKHNFQKLFLISRNIFSIRRKWGFCFWSVVLIHFLSGWGERWW